MSTTTPDWKMFVTTLQFVTSSEYKHIIALVLLKIWMFPWPDAIKIFTKIIILALIPSHSHVSNLHGSMAKSS